MKAEATLAPIERDLVVHCPVERAFDVFTRRIGEWWPLHTHSIAAETRRTAVTVTLEGAVGGRLFETQDDGTECRWGTVQVWDPPRHVAIEWRVNPAAVATLIDVFFDSDPDGTRVRLTHSGWDAAGHRAGYDDNWDGVLRLFAARAEG